MHTPVTDSSLPSTPTPENPTASSAGSQAGANQPFVFHGAYVGSMEMAATRQMVTEYLDVHQEWFRRCAHPMQAHPIGDNGYALTVGRFGALGYDVEPRIGLHLLPQEQGIYRIETIPVPDYAPQGYDVDFQAALELKENPAPDLNLGVTTHVEWQLDLAVSVQFPRFIRALPESFIQRTGDHLLGQIVRQVSRCLTHKVQEDFHQSRQLELPESYRDRHHHFFDRLSKGLHLS